MSLDRLPSGVARRITLPSTESYFKFGWSILMDYFDITSNFFKNQTLILSKLRSFTTLAMVISSSVKTTMKKSSMAKSSCRVLGAIASKQIFSRPWHLMCSRWLSWTVSEDPWPVFLPCGCVTCLAIMYSMCSLDNSGLVRQDCAFSMAKGQRHKGIIGHRRFCIELRSFEQGMEALMMQAWHIAIKFGSGMMILLLGPAPKSCFCFLSKGIPRLATQQRNEGIVGIAHHDEFSNFFITKQWFHYAKVDAVLEAIDENAHVLVLVDACHSGSLTVTFMTLLDMASLDPLDPMTSQAQFVTSILVCFLDAMNSPSFLSLVLPLVSIFRWAERGQAHKRCRAGIVWEKNDVSCLLVTLSIV